MSNEEQIRNVNNIFAGLHLITDAFCELSHPESILNEHVLAKILEVQSDLDLMSKLVYKTVLTKV